MSNTTQIADARHVIDLRGKRGLVIGIANEHSIAAGCAEAFAATPDLSTTGATPIIGSRYES